MTLIRTPDQRVRVFISSTINELAEERRAARDAIRSLRLTAVFFEAGARPHPARDLYSAYLEQSHVFLGIYWNSYGWVAPGAELSGLEDEYRLSASKPRLIYVKRSVARERRLNQLLADIEKSDTACYQLFTDADELRELIENDLSVLMSESFQHALLGRAAPDSSTEVGPAARTRLLELPPARTELVGREADLAAVSSLLGRDDTSVVTLLGAGGTGKTALAVRVAHHVQASFADGAAFVALAPVTDPRLVAATIADRLGVQDSGKQPLADTLAEYLAEKNMLLVLDNFEQVADASRLVSELVLRAHGLRVLVTSRTSLHVRGERIYHLAPLATPEEGSHPTPDELTRFPATELFLRRAHEVNPGLDLTPENAAAIVQICQRLDGLPLAIELAAARTRFFQPAALTARLGRTLDLVSKGHRDLPERQQTLRAAIEWSYNLLGEETRRAFRQLGVFRRAWTLEAADVVLDAPGGERVDVEELTERLLDVSLIRAVPVRHAAEPRFSMLQTVHEYALEALLASPEGAETTVRFADHFRRLCVEADPNLWGPTSEAWLDKLEIEYQNVRAAFHAFADSGRMAQAWEMIPAMVRYWTIRGGFSEGLDWLAGAGVPALERHGEAPFAEIGPALAGRTLTWSSLVYLLLFRLEQGFPLLERALQMLRGTNDEVSLAYALVIDGAFTSAFRGGEAAARMEEAAARVRRLSDPGPLLSFLTWSNEYYMRSGELRTVEANVKEATRLATEAEYTYILGSLQIMRYNLALLADPIDLDELAQSAEVTLRTLPEKGYKVPKAAAAFALALSQMLRGQLEDARTTLRRGVDLARQSGEMEALLFSVLASAHLEGRAGNRELGLRLLGAADQFVARTGYPLAGASHRQHAFASAAVNPDGADLSSERVYLEGRRLRLEDAAVLALRG
jgi:predicted ATPase